jgi:hypothetical protein
MIRTTAKPFALLLLCCAVLLPQLSHATKSGDKSMTAAVLDGTEKLYDGFEATAKAWKKAAPGSPEAEALAAKGEGELAALESEVNKQQLVFEAREKWYADQGMEYAEGREFMFVRIKRLKRFLDNAKELDLYKKLRP